MNTYRANTQRSRASSVESDILQASNETNNYLSPRSLFPTSPVQDTFDSSLIPIGESQFGKWTSASPNSSHALSYNRSTQTDPQAIQWTNWDDFEIAMSLAGISDGTPRTSRQSSGRNSSSSTFPEVFSLLDSGTDNRWSTVEASQSFDTFQRAQNAGILNAQSLSITRNIQADDFPLTNHKRSASEAQLPESHASFAKLGDDSPPRVYYNPGEDNRTLPFQSDLEGTPPDAVPQFSNYNALPLLLIPEEPFMPGLSYTQNNSPWSSSASDSTFFSGNSNRTNSNRSSNSSLSDRNDLNYSSRSRSSSASGPEFTASPHSASHGLWTPPVDALSRSNSRKFLDVPNSSPGNHNALLISAHSGGFQSQNDGLGMSSKFKEPTGYPALEGDITLYKETGVRGTPQQICTAYRCSVENCNVELGGEDEAQRHRSEAHKPLPCPIKGCNIRFNREPEVELHFNKVHKDVELNRNPQVHPNLPKLPESFYNCPYE